MQEPTTQRHSLTQSSCAHHSSLITHHSVILRPSCAQSLALGRSVGVCQRTSWRAPSEPLTLRTKRAAPLNAPSSTPPQLNPLDGFVRTVGKEPYSYKYFLKASRGEGGRPARRCWGAVALLLNPEKGTGGRKGSASSRPWGGRQGGGLAETLPRGYAPHASQLSSSASSSPLNSPPSGGPHGVLLPSGWVGLGRGPFLDGGCGGARDREGRAWARPQRAVWPGQVRWTPTPP
jgi:hypothetical protein